MEVAFWRDLSVIWLSLFCFVTLVLPIAALYFVVRGMDWLHRKSYTLAKQAQGLSGKVRIQSGRISNQVSEPVIRLNVRAKRFEGFLRNLSGIDGASSGNREGTR